jgi:hypothetical protein
MRRFQADPARLRGQLVFATVLLAVVVVASFLNDDWTAPVALACLVATGVAVAIWPRDRDEEPVPPSAEDGDDAEGPRGSETSLAARRSAARRARGRPAA